MSYLNADKKVSPCERLNRRDYLRVGAFAFLGCLTPGLLKRETMPGQSRPVEPILGVQLYSFRNQMKQDVKGALAQVRSMGFTDVEAAGYKWKSAEEFRALLDEAGLRCISFFADYEKLRDDLESVVKDAQALGAKYAIVGGIPHKKEFTLEDCNRAIAHFNEWGNKLAARGLRFAYHIHGFEFYPHEKGTLFDKLVAETRPESVAIEMDVFWVAYPGQDPVKLLNKYGRRVELMHLKDLRKGVKGDLSGHADEELNVTIGTGQIDFRAIVRTARKIGVKYLFIEDESSRVMEQVPQSLRYLKGLL